MLVNDQCCEYLAFRIQIYHSRHTKFENEMLLTKRCPYILHLHWKLDTMLCFMSWWRYSVVSETGQTALYGTSRRDISLYYAHVRKL